MAGTNENNIYNSSFLSTYTDIYECDLLKGRLILLAQNKQVLQGILYSGNLAQDIGQMAKAGIHPEDEHIYRGLYDAGQIIRRFEAGENEILGEYRRLGKDGKYHWVMAMIVPTAGWSDANKTAMILIKDITEYRAVREKETRQQYITEQYDAALRRIYDELYELNVTRNSYKIVYHARDKYVTPAESGALDAATLQVANEMIHPEDKERFLHFFDIDAIRKTFAFGKESVIGEFRKLWHDGDYHWASLTLFPVRQENKGDEIYLCFIMDIGDKKKADEIEEQNRLLKKRRLSDERYRIVVDQTNTIVFEENKKTGMRYIPEQLKRELEGTYDQRDIFDIWIEDGVVYSDDVRPVASEAKELRRGDRNYFELTLRLKKRGGRFAWYKMSQTSILDRDGNVERIIGTLNDVDEFTKSQETLRYRAEFDALTGIYNTQTFYSRAQQAMRENPQGKYAVIRMDINKFKYINDLFGLEEGDRILRYIAGILKQVAKDAGVCGRVGGDVFCLCISYETPRELSAVTEKISKSLGEYGLGYKMAPYFGICLVEDRDIPVSILCDWAHLALKTVKGNMLTNTAYYDDKLRAKQLQERKIEEEMEASLANGQFEIWFQPKYRIDTGRIIGAEALVRWNHPGEGLIMPDSFIPLFESNGFIVRLDEYVWEQVFRMIREWIDNGHKPVPISVNVSRVHIYNNDFLSKLLELADQYDLPRELVELELTESTFIENETGLYERMHRLQKEGFRFSMDDFGSGYSSLNMLKSTQVDTIKLDRGFLSEAVATQKGRTVIKYVIAMAKQLQLKVISEGVENREQAEFLLSVGCALAQGYFFSKPVPRGELEKKLLENA